MIKKINIFWLQTFVFALFCIPFLGFTLRAQSENEVDSLQTKVDANRQEIDSLKKELALLDRLLVHKLDASDILSRRLIEQFGYGGFVVAGESARISIGGLIIGNAYQDFRELGSGNHFAVSSIVTGGGPFYRTRFDVGNSRFFINSDVKTELMDYKTRFEFDFFSGTGNYVFRFRQAFVEFGRFGIGYTNTNFSNVDITPDIIENAGAIGEVGIRQTQFRYTHPLSASTRFVVAVEDSEGHLLKDGAQVPSSRISPDLVANIRYKPSYSDITQIQLAAAVHPLDYEEKANPFKSHYGWGASVGGALKLFKNDYISAQASYAKGATKYFNDPVVGYDAIVTTNSDSSLTVKPMEIFGCYLYYHHRWSEHYASNFGYSNVRGVKAQYADEAQQIAGHYANLNLLYYPNNKMSFGLETIFGMRENIDGTRDFNTRVQFQVKFSF